MPNETWCFHSHPPQVHVKVQEGVAADGVVVCVHPFGLGVYLSSEQGFGHVDVPMMGRPLSQDLADYPPVGSTLQLEVLGYSGRGQLRMRVLT